MVKSFPTLRRMLTTSTLLTEIHAGRVGLRHHVLGGDLGEHDKAQVGIAAAGLTDKLDAVHSGHEKIHQHDIRTHIAQVLQRIQSAGRTPDHTAGVAVFDDHTQDIEGGRIVINQVEQHAVFPPVPAWVCGW